ncbi:YicC/YloC family endoribonuclease [Bacillus sp. T33-2]|uniref:YicC/YloC family endoribonuclease n=1 Tax=Bacillus sp. T33-2 TaxID=2054168 RepID=UPI000C766986|nr:YicC/YloC family endoribonuclease [Bacillus sp. T33-2]PLR97340.1 YicC family protein [Bacillus sp. T33-2]
MVVSMTGFGRSTKESGQFNATVEIKTVNHRFCEFHIRMPRQLLAIEDKLKKNLGSRIDRGRVEVFVMLEGEGTVNRSVHIDWKLMDEYVRHIADIKEKYKVSGEVTIQDLVSREELIVFEEKAAGNDELEHLVLMAADEAAQELMQMRLQEGSALEKDVTANIGLLRDHVLHIKQYAPAVIEQYRERLSKKLHEFVGGIVDEARVLTEAAVFADKADINEELTRLDSHIAQFFKILTLTDPVGRKLDFLVQEMNREVNTIGSKANDAEIARAVVEMKSLLEKVKEQVQNIE